MTQPIGIATLDDHQTIIDGYMHRLSARQAALAGRRAGRHASTRLSPRRDRLAPVALMRERTALIGAQLYVQTAPGCGTQVRVTCSQ
jgi:hypothetical protein